MKYAPRTSTEAVKWARSKVGQAIYSGMCQAFTVTAFGTGAVGDYDGDRDADAVDGWKKAVANGKVVRASQIKDFTKIPAGVALYWSGGSRGFGHAAVSIGGGRMVTTDYAGGRVGIATIKGWWSRSHTFLGYVLVEGNGYTLTDKPKPRPVRGVTWNTALKVGPKPDYRRKKITAYLRKWDLDFVALQECPWSGEGRELFPLLRGIGLSVKTGSHGRYTVFGTGTDVIRWKSVDIGGKRATMSAVELNGARRLVVNCHPRSGSDTATRSHRERWAEKIIVDALKYADACDVPRSEIVFLGDFNGNEFATVAKRFGFVRASSYARIKSALTRTYNAWGKKRTTPGGRFSYVLVHQSKKGLIAKAKTFFTPKASDHNPVFVEIKE